MVWDPDLNPEGAAERFTRTVGPADFFLTFGQFLYADENPTYASGGLSSVSGALKTDTIVQLSWQGGLTYHFAEDTSAKIAGTVHHYIGTKTNTPPFFGDAFVGEGAYLGPGTIVNGNSGWTPGGSSFAPFAGFPNNQNGLNHLVVVEVPFEVNFKIDRLDARVFGDLAYNLDGEQRAKEAAAAYAYYLSINNAQIKGFDAQVNDRKAYQIGFAIGSHGSLGLVNGANPRKHAWEARAYWQHVEQYALDPNLLDSDFFEGRGNMQGAFASVAYGFGANVIGTFRYGYATRINKLLGTGGSNQDIPQVNPIEHYNLVQFDLTMKF
jgi:hypothetical protein